MPSPPETLALEALAPLVALSGARKLVAISGPPGAGKSTFAEALRAALVAAGHSAAVLPMDGFHLDNRVLAARGLLPRKGAPETFDAAGFLTLVRRVAAGEEVAYPLFDRARDISIAGAGVLPRDTEFVLFEGNYLLLRKPPWDGLREYWDFAIEVDPGRDEIGARLLDRWLSAGLPPDQAAARRDGNDLPNAELVWAESAAPDLRL